MTGKKAKNTLDSAIHSLVRKIRLIRHNKHMNKAHDKRDPAVKAGRNSTSGQFVRGRVELGSNGEKYFHIDLS